LLLLALICTEQQHLTEEQKASGTMRQGLLSQEIYTKKPRFGLFYSRNLYKNPFYPEKAQVLLVLL
jgi:hypothetical protein